ncbi:leucyl/phenylalanyl-tRNA--protein transferase [Allopusillimonas ginsengisoli]|uniref:leucyl/phenylalanyl-tRNA--protein transferase n=1 Tax=Allopusillimonas ginsengisoli TaxID=453575 RepID=UPI00101F5A53|nr:leucyl/phenylalanyl-tRNA--protein transferase [Allopusillimonas ginsengisoli]TEA77440.1 leucyl/phenylalanyl-tRNA--protein transferase [Allopusillimonas ginsengisoli]
MGKLIWLDIDTPFPPVEQALPEGLLAAGAELSLTRLEQAYRRGIFPWFNEGDPVLWWSPNPRMVLACAEFKISRSLGKRLRQMARDEHTPAASIRITLDMAMADVITACAGPRATQHGTWISSHIKAAYLAWHEAGAVHSVETWINGELAGGLYGVSLGGFFFGESMFSRANDASKLALAYLTRFLARHGVHHIDCQQQTGHLASLGAQPIAREQFLAILKTALNQPAPPWKQGQLLSTGELAPVA